MATGAKILGRSYDLLTALALSAILLILDSPAYLYSSSFLLSFGAVVGLGVTAPVLSTFFASERKLINALLASFAVQITTLPLVLTIYGEVSVAGLLLNLIVLPTVSIVLLSGLGCCVLWDFFIWLQLQQRQFRGIFFLFCTKKRAGLWEKYLFAHGLAEHRNCGRVCYIIFCW